MAQPEAEERPMLGIRVSGAGDTRVNGTYLPDPDFVGEQPTYRLQPDGDAKIYKLAGTWKLVHNASPGYLYIGDGEHALGAVWILGGGGRGPVPEFSASTWLATSHPEPTAIQALLEVRPDRERPGLGQRGEDWKRDEARKKLDDGRLRQGADLEARRKQLEEDRRKREAEAEARRAAQSEKPRQAVVSSRTAAENAKVSTSPSADQAPSLAALRRDGATLATRASLMPTDRVRVTATVARASASTSQIAGQSEADSGTRGPPQLAAPNLAASKLATASPSSAGAQKPAAKEDTKKDRERELGELMAKRKLEMMRRLATR